MHGEVRSFVQPASTADYRQLARRRLPRQVFDYLEGGSYDETTMAGNLQALRRLQLRQRVLRDVSQVDLSCELFGQKLDLPLALGPVGLAGLFAGRGEVQAARAAAAAGIPFCESTVSICSLEEVRQASTAPLWFQLYFIRDRGYARELLRRAADAGYGTLVFTVDLAVLGARYRDLRNGMAGASSLRTRLARGWDILRHPRWVRDVPLAGKPLTFGNLSGAVPDAHSLTAFRAWVDDQFDPSVTWRDLAWLRDNWPGPILLKGILDPEDARQAVELEFDGVIVSNHGGRQLDSVPASITALPSIVEAVAGRTEVLLDGGIRSGLDVVKALACGARACLLGRAWAYALAAGGEQSLTRLLDTFRQEMHVAMALTGSTRLSDLGPQVLAQEAS